ncbi:MAG TPA: acyl-CoA dehydrogenase, partial [Acidimicrobiia bacterium]|nr:acyl-CoA dehydrogenase [Acidimicrobiia bacterium]
VEETGAAQFYRDARIAPIYEGTNGIQAIDLVTRKLPLRGGEVALELLKEIEATATGAPRELADMAAPLAAATAVLRQATRGLLASLSESPGDALAGASPYLKMFGTVLGGWFHLRSALAARDLLERGEGDRSFLESRIGLARFYNRQVLPTAPGLLEAVLAPESDLAASNLV